MLNVDENTSNITNTTNTTNIDKNKSNMLDATNMNITMSNTLTTTNIKNTTNLPNNVNTKKTLNTKLNTVKTFDVIVIGNNTYYCTKTHIYTKQGKLFGLIKNEQYIIYNKNDELNETYNHLKMKIKIKLSSFKTIQ